LQSRLHPKSDCLSFLTLLSCLRWQYWTK